MRYPKAYKIKVLKVKQAEKLTIRATAQRFQLAVATVQKWLKSTDNQIIGRPRGTAHRLPDAQLLAYMHAHPDAYQREAAMHFGVTPQAIARGLKRIHWSRKKNVAAPKS